MSPHIAYLVSRFPKVSETFITREACELRNQGIEVRFFSLKREAVDVVQPESAPFVDDASYGRLSWALVAAQLHWIATDYRAYFGVWWAALRGNVRSPGFLARALIVVPIAALFAREMSASGVRHVHAHWATHPGLAAYAIRRLAGIPYSITVHMHDLYDDRAMLEEKLGEASFVVTISQYNKDLIQRLYGAPLAERVVVIHCGIDLDRFTRTLPESDGIPIVLCVGTLEARKGQRDLVEVIVRLRHAGRAVRCVLIGDGPERPALERLIAERGATDFVQLRGSQSSNHVRDALRAASIVVLPSEAEGIPVALMEALATERPVVSTDVYGIPELVENEVTGLLVEPHDLSELSSAIARLLDDAELRARLAKSGRKRVEEEFDIRTSVTKLKQLICASTQG